MGFLSAFKAGYREAMTGEPDVEHRRQEDESRAYDEERIRNFKARAEQRKAEAAAAREQRAAARRARRERTSAEWKAYRADPTGRHERERAAEAPKP